MARDVTRWVLVASTGQFEFPPAADWTARAAGRALVEKGKGVGPRQLATMTCKSREKEVRTGGISAFLMAKEGRKKGADGESKETLPAGPDWHITHRCHKREFLLKFARDRRRWLEILLEATKRYGLVVLNYGYLESHSPARVRWEWS
jgi:hypothetical protein